MNEWCHALLVKESNYRYLISGEKKKEKNKVDYLYLMICIKMKVLLSVDRRKKPTF